MKIFYTLLDALVFLKREIERLENRMKKEKNRYYRDEIESLVEWRLERGLKIIGHARKGEIDQEAIDFFLGRVKQRPDKTKLEKQIEKE